MKLKVGDKVEVISGSDKGKTGKIIKTLRNENKVIIEGVHIVKKHQKGNGQVTGGILEVEAPIDARFTEKDRAPVQPTLLSIACGPRLL